VGVLLAARNPTRVTNLILCSPPTDLCTAVPVHELTRNMAFLTNPILSPFLFGMILEQSWALRFFSNTFLFAYPCDEDWMVAAQANTTPLMRPPIAAFNAGMCQHRSLETELQELSQPTLILTGGEKDQRDRQTFVEIIKDCTWIRLPNCCNVLPWEDPEQVYACIQHFLSSRDSTMAASGQGMKA
jgi:pimeloyl-ACP methyl ester carboxylesterase